MCFAVSPVDSRRGVQDRLGRSVCAECAPPSGDVTGESAERPHTETTITSTRTLLFLAATQLVACADVDAVDANLSPGQVESDNGEPSTEQSVEWGTESGAEGAGDLWQSDPSERPETDEDEAGFDDEEFDETEEAEESDELDGVATTTSGTIDTGPDTGGGARACGENELRIQADDGLPLATFTQFVFHDDGESVWMYGFEDIQGSDACDWAASPADAAGYVISIEVSSELSVGAEKAWMDDDDTDDAAEVRIENAGTNDLIEAVNDSGALIVERYAAGNVIVMSGFNGSFDDGSYVVDGDIHACYCGSAVVE